MLARTFDPTESEDEDSENDRDDNEHDLQDEGRSEQDAFEPPAKKKRAFRGPRPFIEVDHRDRSDSTDEDIIVFIRRP